MDSLEHLFNKINIADSEHQVQIYNSETKVLIQNFETLKWLKTCIREHKGVSIDLLNTFLLGLKHKFTIYITKNFNEETEIIKDFMYIYIKYIENVLNNSCGRFLTKDFMVETAFQIHKMLVSSLKI